MYPSLELNYQEFGQGRPVTILHGLFGSSTNWRGIAKTLSDTLKVYTLDMRNHGNSPWSNNMTYDAMAEDLRHFLVTHDLENASVIGHSMGGKTAMLAALQFPELIDRLAILDIAPVTYSHTHAPYIEAMRSIDLHQLKNRSNADTALKSKIPEAGIRQFLLQSLLFKNGTYSWRINLDVLDNAMEELTGFPVLQNQPVYSGKTLFLYGGKSDYVQTTFHQQIYRLFPNAIFEVVENAGHWLHAEQPKRVCAALRDLLK